MCCGCAASELVGRLPLMQVSDKLTWIAEVILEQVLAVAWADLTKKYGAPLRERRVRLRDFWLWQAGRHRAGLRLRPRSGVHLRQRRPGGTDGERSIDNTVFYTRLGQRMIHILETRTNLGQLYEVDMRLRPSGNSGMLVCTLQGFRSYQQDAAWTWEHQALVRARFVAGDPELAAAVEAVRIATLCRPRELATLAQEVQQMRERMREHLLPAGPSHGGNLT